MSTASTTGTRGRGRGFLLGFLLVSLLVAGVASYYASSHPDGLEYVAGETGFLDSATEHQAADSPLADYGVKGVENERLSVGLAGVVGVGVVALVSTGLFLVLRRRDAEPAGPATP